MASPHLELVQESAALGFGGGGGELRIGSRSFALAPPDVPLGMSCPVHSIVHFVRGLAGPWGLPIAMDGRRNAPGHRNLFGPHARRERSLVRRVVVYFDLNYPQNTFCKMRGMLNAAGGRDVHVLTLGFPTKGKPRGLGYANIQHCAPRWSTDNEWISNAASVPELSSRCRNQELPTPCELIMGLVQRLRPPEFPNIEAIRVMGFSAAAQVLDKCMYSIGRSGRGLHPGGPDVRFLIVSPSTLLYPVPERAVFHSPNYLSCGHFDPASLLQQRHRFRLPGRHAIRMASVSRHPGWYCHKEPNRTETVAQQREECLRPRRDSWFYRFTQGDQRKAPGCRGCWCCRQRIDLYRQEEHECKNYDHYREGFKGRMPPDMPTGGTCFRHRCAENVRSAVRRALLQHHALYIAGSADVCNWQLQSRMSPRCGWCMANRTLYRGNSSRFSRDIISPIVDSCRAMWQGTTRLERMKVYKDLVEEVVAPRVGVSWEELRRTRQFFILLGAGHSDNTVVQLLAGCLIHDDRCNGEELVPMDELVGAGEGLLVRRAAEGKGQRGSGMQREAAGSEP